MGNERLLLQGYICVALPLLILCLLLFVYTLYASTRPAFAAAAKKGGFPPSSPFFLFSLMATFTLPLFFLFFYIAHNTNMGYNAPRSLVPSRFPRKSIMRRNQLCAAAICRNSVYNSPVSRRNASFEAEINWRGGGRRV